VIGLVLAAGAGRRLSPDTDQLPKALLPVAGAVTILDLALANLASAGAAEVVIVVGHAAGVIESRVADLQREHGIAIVLVPNDRALEWNNAYSLWLARHRLSRGALLVNGDTVHPASVEQLLLRSSSGPGAAGTGRVIIAIDQRKRLGEEEMKVRLGSGGRVLQITKAMPPEQAHGEYIGVTLIEPAAARPLAEALEATWRRDPGLYYEDGFAEFAARGGELVAAPIGTVPWVEVDNHADLQLARQIAARC
jgi:choline kinase